MGAGTPYSPNVLEGLFREVRAEGVLAIAYLGKKVPGVLCKRRGISASPGSF
jgi:hypothetical protein